jgi:hypothetical protein
MASIPEDWYWWNLKADQHLWIGVGVGSGLRFFARTVRNLVDFI